MSPGFSNGFVAKLNADGSSSAVLHVLDGNPEGSGIALDHEGNAYIAGIVRRSFSVTAGAAQDASRRRIRRKTERAPAIACCMPAWFPERNWFHAMSATPNPS